MGREFSKIFKLQQLTVTEDWVFVCVGSAVWYRSRDPPWLWRCFHHHGSDITLIAVTTGPARILSQDQSGQAFVWDIVGNAYNIVRQVDASSWLSATWSLERELVVGACESLAMLDCWALTLARKK